MFVKFNPLIGASTNNINALTKATKNMSLEQTISAMAQKKVTQETAEAVLAQRGYNSEQIKTSMANYGLASSHGVLAGATKLNEEATEQLIKDVRALTLEQALAKLSQQGLTQETAEAILVKAGYNKGCIQGSISNYTFATSTNVSTAAIKANTLALVDNMKKLAIWLVMNPVGRIVLIAGAVLAAVAAYKKWGPTVENLTERMEESAEAYNEAKSELESLNNELKTTQDRIDELNAKDNLTFTEKGELQTLKETSAELERQIALQEERVKLAAEEAAMDARKLHNKQYGDFFEDEGSYKDDVANSKERYKYAAKANEQAYGGGSLTSVFTETDDPKEIVSQYQAAQELYQEAMESGNNHLADTYLSIMGELKESLLDEQGDIDEQINNMEARVKEIKSMDESERSDEDNLLLSTYEDAKALQDYLDSVVLNPDAYKSLKITDALATEGVEEDKEHFVDLAEAGELTPELIKKEYPKLNEALEEAGVTTEEFCEEMEALGEEAEDTAEAVQDVADVDYLAGIAEGMESVNSAYEEFQEQGWVTGETLAGISDEVKKAVGDEQFDLFKNIVGNPESTTQACQEAFNQLVTDYLQTESVLRGIVEGSEADMQIYIANLKKLGITNAEEVVNAIRSNYTEINSLTNAAAAEYMNLLQQEYNACHDWNAAKAKITSSYLQQIGGANAALINAMGEGYEDDYNNWLKLMSEKAMTYNQLASRISASMAATARATGGVTGFELVDQAAGSFFAEIQQINTAFSANFSAGKVGGLKYSGSGSGSGGGGGSESDPEQFNWIEVAISRIQRIIENLNKTVSATYKQWSKRNEALASEIGEVHKEISLQQQAYDYYMKKADSVGLSSYYKSLVQSGAIKIEDVADEALAEQINLYTEWYEAALECSDAIQDLEADLADLAMTRFDNVSKEFEDQMSIVEHEMDMIEGQISLTEAKGYIVSEKYYDKLANLEKQNLSYLEAEKKALTDARDLAVANGEIEIYSEDWYSMTGDINDADKAIQDAQLSLVELNNTMRELRWENFDRMQEMMSQIQSESDFLIDLMSNEKLVVEGDQGAGNFTEYGQATMGLHAVNYNAYMAQADEYAKEMMDIDKQLANDPYNQTLLERRQELLESQRDAINSAEDEKQAIKDLYSDAYDALLNYMQELIDKRKEMLQTVKDLYDYEKNVAEQTKEIANLEKQLAAYQGDDSEETRSTIQQLKVSLEEARENLEETEYDRFISDQEQLYETLVDETQEWIDGRLDDINGLLQSAIDVTNTKSDEIKETLTTTTDNVGTELSNEMNAIWSSGGVAANVVALYGDDFSSKLTTTNTVLTDIKNLVASMVTDADKKANSSTVDTTPNYSNPGHTGTTPSGSLSGSGSGSSYGSSSSSKPASSSSSSTSTSSSSSSDWGSWFVSKTDSFPKSKLNINTSIVDEILIVHVKHLKLREHP